MNETSFIISIFALAVAIIGVCVAIRVFKRTATLQIEMYMLDAIKEYANSEKGEKQAEQFLTAIDMYCKYVVNGHLDKKLSDDNLKFYKDTITIYKDIIKENGKFNNIANYAKKYNINL